MINKLNFKDYCIWLECLIGRGKFLQLWWVIAVLGQFLDPCLVAGFCHILALGLTIARLDEGISLLEDFMLSTPDISNG